MGWPMIRQFGFQRTGSTRALCGHTCGPHTVWPKGSKMAGISSWKRPGMAFAVCYARRWEGKPPRKRANAMLILELEENERRVLHKVLAHAVDELAREIHRTERIDFRKGLEEDQLCLQRIADRVQPIEPAIV
jgi:hypothetical protein